MGEGDGEDEDEGEAGCDVCGGCVGGPVRGWQRFSDELLNEARVELSELLG